MIMAPQQEQLSTGNVRGGATSRSRIFPMQGHALLESRRRCKARDRASERSKPFQRRARDTEDDGAGNHQIIKGVVASQPAASAAVHATPRSGKPAHASCKARAGGDAAKCGRRPCDGDATTSQRARACARRRKAAKALGARAFGRGRSLPCGSAASSLAERPGRLSAWEYGLAGWLGHDDAVARCTARGADRSVRAWPGGRESLTQRRYKYPPDPIPPAGTNPTRKRPNTTTEEEK